MYIFCENFMNITSKNFTKDVHFDKNLVGIPLSKSPLNFESHLNPDADSGSLESRFGLDMPSPIINTCTASDYELARPILQSFHVL